MSRRDLKPVSLPYLAHLSLFWLGISTVWGGLNIVYLPDRVETLVGSAQKGTYLGILVFVGLLVAVVVQPVMGGVSDRSMARWGRRRPYMLVGSLVSALFLLLMAAVGNYALLLAVIVLLQISGNSALGPYQGIVPDIVPASQRGRASGFLGLAKQLGTLFGAVAAGAFLDRGSPGGYLFVATLVLVMVAVISALTIHEDPLEEKPEFSGIIHELRTRIAELRQRPGFAWVLFSRLFFFMGLLAGNQLLLFFIRERLGIADNAGLYVTIALGVLIVVAAVISLPAGWIADRMDRRTLVFISCSVGVVGSLSLTLATNYPMVLVGFSILGVAVGIFVTADWALAIDLIPDPKAAGLYMGLTNLSTAGGDALASLTAGVVLDIFNGIQPLLGYPAVFIMMALFFALGAGTILKVPKTYMEEQQVPSEEGELQGSRQ